MRLMLGIMPFAAMSLTQKQTSAKRHTHDCRSLATPSYFRKLPRSQTIAKSDPDDDDTPESTR